MGVALRRLRRLSTALEGPASELDLDATVAATADGGGALRLMFRATCGASSSCACSYCSMSVALDGLARGARGSPLQRGAPDRAHFHRLVVRDFHNCVYDRLYETAQSRPDASEPTRGLLARLSPEYKLVVVGDACMAPSELTMAGGAIDWYQDNEEPGHVWLSRRGGPLLRTRPGSTRCPSGGGRASTAHPRSRPCGACSPCSSSRSAGSTRRSWRSCPRRAAGRR